MSSSTDLFRTSYLHCAVLAGVTVRFLNCFGCRSKIRAFLKVHRSTMYFHLLAIYLMTLGRNSGCCSYTGTFLQEYKKVSVLDMWKTELGLQFRKEGRK